MFKWRLLVDTVWQCMIALEKRMLAGQRLLTLRNISSRCKQKGAIVPENMENICLKHDNGDELCFQGRLFSECSHFDEENSSLTRQQLFLTESGEHVYYIIRSGNGNRTRHAYRLHVQDEECTINNGKAEITLKLDMLLLAVRSLCGLGEEDHSSLAMVEELLKAAGS